MQTLMDSQDKPTSQATNLENLHLDANHQEVRWQEQSITLRRKIFVLLSTLLEYQGRVVPRELLIDKVWNGNHYVGDRGLTHAICVLRGQLRRLGCTIIRIQTVPKFGYRLDILFHLTKSCDLPRVDVSSPNWWPQEELKQAKRRVI